MTLILTTYDWVPDMPRGFVRDIRVRWLLEEIDRPYAVDTVPLREKSAEHFARQPFGQVPMIRDGDLSLFESGAILLYLAEGTGMMPDGPDRHRAIQWLFAALNSLEPFTMVWAVAKFFQNDEAAAARHEVPLRERLGQIDKALAGRDWLVADRFTVADLLLADTLRVPAGSGLLDGLPSLAAYLERAVARPAFARAHAAQMAHWAAADARQAAGKVA